MQSEMDKLFVNIVWRGTQKKSDLPTLFYIFMQNKPIFSFNFILSAVGAGTSMYALNSVLVVVLLFCLVPPVYSLICLTCC